MKPRDYRLKCLEMSFRDQIFILLNNTDKTLLHKVVEKVFAVDKKFKKCYL